jgi:DNA-binding PadR family transcriptional regulator
MLPQLNPLLHSELRLAVMSILVGVEEADFVFLREQTGSTAGNLSVQIDKLQSAGYIEAQKTFHGKKPRTICRITPAGVNAFEEYVAALQGYITVPHQHLSNGKE